MLPGHNEETPRFINLGSDVTSSVVEEEGMAAGDYWDDQVTFERELSQAQLVPFVLWLRSLVVILVSFERIVLALARFFLGSTLLVRFRLSDSYIRPSEQTMRVIWCWMVPSLP